MRKLQFLSIIAIVAMLSTMASAVPPPWAGVATEEIPVVMDIVPSVSIVTGNAKIKLEPVDYQSQGPTPNTWTGVADPQPRLFSNVRVSVTGKLDVVNPVIQDDSQQWGIALQGQPWKTGSHINDLGESQTYVTTTDPIYLDVEYIPQDTGREIPIAVYVTNPNFAARPVETDSVVAIVTLTASPY
jgi:hypothetical protein